MEIKKITLQVVTISFLVFLSSCVNNTEEPIIDCSLSDLAVEVSSSINADCGSPGSLTVIGSGGTGNYEYSVDGITFQTSGTLRDLSAGSYVVQVRDSDGCSASISTSVESEPGSVELSIVSTNSDCIDNTGTITASVSGGVAPFTYSLNGSTFQDESIFNNVSNGTNSVTVRDSDGCEVTRVEVVSSGVSLSDDIMPIISSNCAVTGCHNGSRNPDLRTVSGIISSADRIKRRTSARTMPPTGRQDLSDTQIQLIACWVDDGAQNN